MLCRIGVVRKYTSGEEDEWESRLSDHQVRGLRAAFAIELDGKGSPSFFTGTGIRRETLSLLPMRDAADKTSWAPFAGTGY